MLEIPKCGHETLTHTLTHTGIAADGQARMYWTDDLQVSSKIAVKTAKSPCAATESWAESSS